MVSPVVRIWSPVALLALGAAVSAPADDSKADLTVGARVRIAAPTWSDKQITGRLLRPPSDVLEIALRDGVVQSVPVASISKLQISSGKKRHVLQGAIAGALLAAGYALLAPGCTTQFCGDDDYGTIILIALGSGGTALGAAVGAAIKTERWTAIPTPRPTVRGPSGPAFSFSFRF
jgi:hypothetical protein